MKAIYLLGALAFCTLTSTGAQAQPAAPSPRQLELSRQLIDISGASANFDKLMSDILRQVFAQAAKGQPAASQQQMVKLEQAQEATLTKIKPRLFEAVETAYATTYTEAEMEGMLAFDRTPAGQAMLAKAPLLTKNVMTGVMALMPVVKTDMINALCNSMNCTAAQRQAMIDKANGPHS